MLIVLLFIVLISNFVYAEKLEIDIKSADSVKVVFSVNIYDDSNRIINGEVDYVIEDYYTDIMSEGIISSGQEVNYQLPKNPVQGPWKITTRYNNVETNQLFQVGKLEKVDIRLEGDNLIIENIGNSVYDRNLLITIGDTQESTKVTLEVGGIRKIRLTAPPGEYVVKINDGSVENELIFSGVSLTGNAVGIERVFEGNFFSRFPLVVMFLGVMFFVVILVLFHRFFKKDSGKNERKKSSKKNRK